MTRIRNLLIGVFAAVIASLAVTAGSASADAGTFSNTNKISIPDRGKANPYPSKIPVSGLKGRVTDIAVTIDGFEHGGSRDVDILLVSPGGKQVMLASDVCGYRETKARRWIFTQDPSAQPMPSVYNGGPCETGTAVYKPTNGPGLGVDNTNDDEFPGAPAGPRPADLDNVIGEDPNGDWKLYVHDEKSFKDGKLPRGWSMSLQTQEPDVLIPSGAAGESSKYPLTRTVAGRDGLVSDVNVSVGGIYHERASDLDMFLEGPNGQKVMLASDACGRARLKNASWTFDDEAPQLLSPDAGLCPPNSYKPTDWGQGGENLPGAPPGPYGIDLSTFDNTEPNGEWKLWINDDEADARGFMTVPFGIEITTRPRAEVAFDTPTAEVDEGETEQVKIVRRSGSPLVTGSVQVTSAAAGATEGEDYDAVNATVEFQRGQTEATVPLKALTDDRREGDEKLLLTVGNAKGDAQVGAPAASEVTIRDRTPAPGNQGEEPGPNGGPGGADRVAPRIGGVRLKPSKFAVARRGAASRRRGTTIRYSLSEAARVTVRIERKRGRRFVRAGSLRRAGKAGVNKVRFTGRIGRRTLRPGAYRLRVVARDAAGNQSKSKARKFRVVRRAR